MVEKSKISVGRPKLFSDEHYKVMSQVFGNDKRKIQNAHYWAGAMNRLDEYVESGNEIDNLEYLYTKDSEKIKQCVLTELGRLHESISKYVDFDTALYILVTVTKNICEYAKLENNNLLAHDAEKFIRNKKMELIKLYKSK